MFLKHLVLQNFRSYSQKKFDFDDQMTIIIGPNTAGKTNLIEAVLLLSTGKSFRAEKDVEMIKFGQEVAWVKGKQDMESTLEVMIAQGEATGGRQAKRYSINGVARSRNNFIGSLPAVLFRPEELDIIIDGPSMRRNFLDDVLEPIDREYRTAKLLYDKALRQRNGLLDIVRETGRRDTEQFVYWDDMLIANGGIITQKREAFLAYVTAAKKDIFNFSAIYDKSVMSEERLLQYKEAEVHAGVTLVGPQRDDFMMFINNNEEENHNVRHFGSRGQQRLVILQLKMLQLQFVQQHLQLKPLFVLDDIFSELDARHIDLVLEKAGLSAGRQVIMTTTHKEFVDEKILGESSVIELEALLHT